ncbi:uncharacterized protein LOC127260958 [Andrographis paniculata]|uniref:uncharacterized protein LOC127260958 n=1 Tax=Andrographis paniculata TaxID=175694 RepID=UPI0021E92CFE|nr:uncharacterized protein LOC127260958 [Andrographis paniculata]
MSANNVTAEYGNSESVVTSTKISLTPDICDELIRLLHEKKDTSSSRLNMAGNHLVTHLDEIQSSSLNQQPGVTDADNTNKCSDPDTVTEKDNLNFEAHPDWR